MITSTQLVNISVLSLLLVNVSLSSTAHMSLASPVSLL